MHELPCQSPNDFGLKILGNIEISRKSLKRLDLMRSTQLPPKSQILAFFGKKLQKVRCEVFQRNIYFPSSREFVSNLLSKILWGNRFLFLTRSRPVDFTFFEDFSIWKVPFAIPEYDVFQKTLFCTLVSSMNLWLNVVPVAAGQYLWRDFYLN